ncbi:MAG: C40 family peptidase [Crocinitomicaceae bacterium]|nr:C40 family peptidase [Crocinitomicaceae bacterium]
MKKTFFNYLVVTLIIFCISEGAYSQTSAFNKLELYYSQGLYKKVYKQSGKLMDNPENDHSLIPTYYRAMSIFNLSGNKKWNKSNENSLNDAIEMYEKLQSLKEGREILESHKEDIIALKQDLLSRLENLKHDGNKTESDLVASIINNYLKNIEIPTESTTIVTKPKEKAIETIEEFTFSAKNRDEIVLFAEKYIGTPYTVAGTSPSTGFDCSGFTSYIMNAYKIELPRRSADQYTSAKKVKENKVKKGDLVFFDSGNGVNHVGMIISEQGQPPVMIHASTTKGVIITDINSSDYWKKRIKGYGTYLE